MWRYLLAALAVLTLVAACSDSSRPVGDTGDVTGTTVEETTFAPVEGARVEVGGKTATSGAGGAFTVTDVPKGDQKLTVAATGYLPFSTTVSVEPGPNEVGQLWLKRSQQDGGQSDGGVEDGPVQEDAQADTSQTDAQDDVLQQDAQHDAQADAQQDAQHDVLQQDAQTDVQSDVGQSDGPVVFPCGTLAGLSATQLTLGIPLTETTWTNPSLTAPHATTPCASGGTAPEKVYWYDLDHIADLVWEVTPASAFNVVAYIRQDCDGLAGGGSPIADPVCADAYADNHSEKVIWLDAQPGRYFFFVDGVTASDVGTFSARLTVREIHDVNQACDDIVARCQSGLTCQQSVCWTTSGWCDHSATGTLQVGVPASDTTVGGADTLHCNEAGYERGLGPNDHYVFTADGTGGTYSVHVTSTDHDLYVYSASDCTDWHATANCFDSTAPRDVYFDLVLAANQKRYIVVDGFQTYEGTYTVQVDKVQFNGVGGACDGHATRCSAGLTCQASQCYDLPTWCASIIQGTLVEGTPVNDTTAGGTNHLTCGAGGPGSGPDDIWALTAATAGTYVVIATSGDHEVFLYPTSDCTSAALATNCSGAAGHQASFDVGLQAGQTTYVVVDGISGVQGGYTLVYHKVQFRNLGEACDPAQALTVRCAAGLYCDQGGHCAQAQAEVEANNTYATANAAVSGRPITGSKSTSTDVDWFSITANAGDVIVAQTSDRGSYHCGNFGGSLDSRLRVFGTDGATLLGENDDISVSEDWCSFVAAQAPATGTYYVALDYFSGGSGTFDYTLRIWARTPSAVAEVEANDDPSTAQSVTAPAWITGAVGAAGEHDYYKFDAPAWQRIWVTANVAAGCTHDDRLAVLSTDGATVLASTSSACDPAGSSPVPAAGTYYARITSSAAFGYNLLVITLPQ